MFKPKHLYETCSLCDGTRKTRRPVERPSGGGILTIPAGSDCPLCTTGLVEIGLTTGQLDRLMDTRDNMLLFVGMILGMDYPTPEDWIALRHRAKSLVPNTAHIEEVKARKGIK